MMEIKIAKTTDDYLKCWKVVNELRPNLTKELYQQLLPEMIKQTYQLIFIEENDMVLSFCGFRYETQFHRGRSIYIDDLCTLSNARCKGLGNKLLDYIIAKAKNEGLQSIHLDSGHQRFDAHRLYLNKGFKITSHHFALYMK